MRKILMYRKKAFADILIPYYCIVGISKKDFIDKMNKGLGSDLNPYAHPVRNGHNIDISIDEKAYTIFIFANTSTGFSFSEAYHIDAAICDVVCELSTKYSFRSGSRYELHSS